MGSIRLESDRLLTNDQALEPDAAKVRYFFDVLEARGCREGPLPALRAKGQREGVSAQTVGKVCVRRVLSAAVSLFRLPVSTQRNLLRLSR